MVLFMALSLLKLQPLMGGWLHCPQRCPCQRYQPQHPDQVHETDFAVLKFMDIMWDDHSDVLP